MDEIKSKKPSPERTLIWSCASVPQLGRHGVKKLLNVFVQELEDMKDWLSNFL